MNARSTILPIAAFVAALAGTASAQVEVIQIRTGNGAVGSPDQQVGVFTWGDNNAPPAAFTANDFATARANRATVGNPPAGWLAPSSFLDTSAKWVGAGSSSATTITNGKGALYAIDFYVSHPNPSSTSAYLEYFVAANGALGGGPAQAVYLNEQPVQFGALGMSTNTAQTFGLGNVAELLRTGRNTLYFTHVPAGNVAAGVMISASVRIGETLPCAPTWSTSSLAGPVGSGVGGMVYDNARDRVVLYRAGGTVSETWEFDGTVWALRNTTSLFSRSRPAVAYDPVRQRTVLFGGQQTGGGLPTEVREWDGTSWTEINAAGGPSARVGAVATYDAARGRVIVAGGLTISPVGVSSEVWSWNGSSWTRLADLPGPRTDGGIAYDASTGRVIYFGGQTSTGSVLADTNTTFAFNGTTWSTLNPLAAPPARDGCSLAYDPIRATIVMFGGEGANVTTAGSTWEFSGGQWAEAGVPSNPNGRFAPGLAFDSARNRMVLFGGTSQSNATSFYSSQAPKIVVQPLPVSITENQPFTLNVAATGPGSLTYRWRKNGVAIASNANNVGATTASFSINNATRADSGAYDVVVTSSCGSETSVAVQVQVSPCYANCDDSSVAPVLNALDFSCFLQRFRQGCPGR